MTTGKLDSPTEGAHSMQGSSGADGLVGTCTYRSGCLLKNVRVSALTRSGDTERPVPEASSRPGSTLFVSFIYLLFYFF